MARQNVGSAPRIGYRRPPAQAVQVPVLKRPRVRGNVLKSDASLPRLAQVPIDAVEAVAAYWLLWLGEQNWPRWRHLVWPPILACVQARAVPA